MKKAKIREIEVGPAPGAEDAKVLREYADMVEQGEIIAYAFIAETKYSEMLLWSYASHSFTVILGLVARLSHRLNQEYDKKL